MVGIFATHARLSHVGVLIASEATCIAWLALACLWGCKDEASVVGFGPSPFGKPSAVAKPCVLSSAASSAARQSTCACDCLALAFWNVES